ncbi:hypothetical protein GN956_G17721 [Arapaima gigas]
MCQFLLDCQQPAASVSPLSTQLRRGRAPHARSRKVVLALQEDRVYLSSSSSSRSSSPCAPLSCLAHLPPSSGP